MAGEQATVPNMGIENVQPQPAVEDVADRSRADSPKADANVKNESDNEMADAASSSGDNQLKRKSSASPERQDKLAKAREARKFGRKKRGSVNTAPASAAKKTKAEDDATSTPAVSKRVTALQREPTRRRSRELKNLGVSMDDPKTAEDPAVLLPYFIPEEQQGKANRPVCREPGGVKWKELRPCRALVRGGDEKDEKSMVNGFDTVDVLVSNPGEPERYEPALVLDQREAPDGKIYLMVAYWWTRDAVRKALSGFKKYLDRKWPKTEPYKWMLGMFFDVITADYVNSKVELDEQFCKTLFFGHISFNFEIFDREANDEESRKEFVKQKLGTEEDRAAMEEKMRKLWTLIGLAFEQRGDDSDDEVEGDGGDGEGDDDGDDEGDGDGDGEGDDRRRYEEFDEFYRRKRAGEDSGSEEKDDDDEATNGAKKEEDANGSSMQAAPPAAQDFHIERRKSIQEEYARPMNLNSNEYLRTKQPTTTFRQTTLTGFTSVNSSTTKIPATQATTLNRTSAASSREPSLSGDVPMLNREQKLQLEAVMASIKRLTKVRSVVDTWCKYELEEPVFEHLKRMIADDAEIDKSVFKYDYFPGIEEFHGRVVGTVTV